MPWSLGEPTVVIIWCAFALVVVVSTLRSKAPRAGLVLAYVVLFFATHALAAGLSLLPQYVSLNPAWTADGLRQATYGLVSFAVGTKIVAPLFLRRRVRNRDGDPEAPQPGTDGTLVFRYLVIGLACYFVLSPLFGKIPSVSALTSTGSRLLVVSLCLGARQGWQGRGRAGMLPWLATALCLPLLSIGNDGFLGFGMSAALAVFASIASFYRPRRHVLPVALAAAYLGLSFFVMYMREREAIRATLWYGGANVMVEDRLQQVSRVFASPEFFDATNTRHLGMVEGRLNQNALVGASVAYLEAGYEDFAQGATLWDAAIAVVPRALWPSKPVTAGSGNLVAHYTGIHFAEGTAVGIGNVGEFYVNFGTSGVILGFLLLGILLESVDRAAGRYLALGDGRVFATWYVPGLSLLQIGNSLVDLTSSAAAAIVMILLINRFFLSRRNAVLPIPRSAWLVPPQPKLSSSVAGPAPLP